LALYNKQPDSQRTSYIPSALILSNKK